MSGPAKVIHHTIKKIFTHLMLHPKAHEVKQKTKKIRKFVIFEKENDVPTFYNIESPK